MFWLGSSTGVGSGCFFFGGYPQAPWGSFYVRVMGFAQDAQTITPYCTPVASNIRGQILVPSGNQALGVPFDMSGPNPNIQYWYRDPLILVSRSAERAQSWLLL